MRKTKINYRVTDDNEVVHAFSIKFKGEKVPKNFGDYTRIVRRIGCSCGQNHILHANREEVELNQQEIFVAQHNNDLLKVNLGTGEIVRRRAPGGS